MILKYLFRKFWQYAPPMWGESQWNMDREEDAWEGVRYQLERIADALEFYMGRL
tara:strand:+ start:282 stop:443 length:162 start_codon:yes stop_codon:yes gene_type:complete